MTVDFNTNILSQLLRQNSKKAIEVQAKYPKIGEWQESKSKPTYRQLVTLANDLNIPFGYFFLKDIPTKEYPIPHYRTNNNTTFEPSSELLDTIQTLKQRQEWARDIIKDLSGDEPQFRKALNINSNIKAAAQKLRETLNLPINWAQDEFLRNWENAFRYLITKIEDAGIFVVVNGVVNNNTKRKLDINEFRGFVLYDEYAPFLFVNNNDFVSGKIFTLAHEVVHVLLGVSASFDFSELMPANDAIEQFCNSVAAEFLVPEDLLQREYNRYGKEYNRLANTFKVSRLVIARRLLDTNRITRQEFGAAYKNFRVEKVEKTATASKGGNFYNTAPYRISKNFFRLVYATVRQNKMLYRDAFRLTGLKPKSFDGYVAKHLTKSNEYTA